MIDEASLHPRQLSPIVVSAMKTLKTRVCAIVFLIFLVAFFLALFPFSAASPRAEITGTDTLRAGDVLTVTFRLNGENLCAMGTTFTYDEEKLTFLSVNKIAAGWSFESFPSSDTTGIIILGVDDSAAAPVNSRTKMFSVSFKVKETLSVGTSVRVRAVGTEASDGETDYSIESAEYRVAISPPKSSDATLSSLSAEQTSLTPEFAPDITEYTAAMVLFDVSSLTIQAQTNHEKASVEILDNELSVGENLIRIKVTAEDGTEKVYKIRIEREQDPNYIPSSNALLSELILSAGTLSPVFSPEITDYLVVVPYEVEQLTVRGQAEHPLAIGCPEQSVLLDMGENLLTLRNRAENGEELAYVIHIIRMPKYEGLLPSVTPGTTAPPETDPPAETDPPPESNPITEAPPVTEPNPAQTGEKESSPEPPSSETEGETATEIQELLSRFMDRTVLIALAATAAVMLGIGLIIGALAAKPKHYKYKYRKYK